MERCREKKKDMHIIFIDLEKTYDKVPRNVMWWALQKHKVSSNYVTLIKDMHNNVVISVRTSDGDTNDFLGLHQGSALSTYLFALVMDEVKETYKVVYLDVCSLQIMWFWWMRVGRRLIKSWSCGDEL
jgi:hypothetical protein